MAVPTETPERVAVVIPCFNEKEAVAETWCSLAREEPHQVVIVDDGSDDERTLEVLDRLRGAGAHVIRQENQGLAAARATGVRATSARYVLPLDGDDILAPGSLTRLADALDADAACAAAWGDFRVFGKIDRIDPKGDRIDPWLLTYIHDLHASLVLRRDVLDEVGGWSDVVFEDWDMSLTLAEHGYRGAYVPGPQIFYRVDDDGLLANASRSRGLTELRQRHDDLFSRRSTNRRSSTAPRSVKMLFPLIETAPFLSADRKGAAFDSLLRRAESRRRTKAPVGGTPPVVADARRAARALLTSEATPATTGG